MARPGSILSQRVDGRAAVSARRRPHRTLRTVALAATAVTFLLIAVGALVRATGSGEGCSGWPKCSAHSWLPPLAYHPIIEYSHRMTAFVDIVLVAALAVVATRDYRETPRLFRMAWLAVALVFAQAGLGAVVVKGGLAALLVTAHFAMAMVLAGVLVYASVAAFSIDVRIAGPVDGFTWLARATAGATFVLMAVGAYVRGQGAGLAFRDWPLMDGRLVPSLSTTPAALQFTHRLLAAIVAVLVIALVVAARKRLRDRRPAAVLAFVAAGLLAAQVFAGAANVWTSLAQPAVVAHVALAGLVWGSLVATAAAARACAARDASVLEGILVPPTMAREAST